MVRPHTTFGMTLAAAALAAGTAAAAPSDRPLFAVAPGLHHNLHTPSALTTWTYSFTYNGSRYSDAFVGTNPSGGGSTTVPVYIIPVKMTYSTTSFSPLSTLGNGQTVIQNIVASPLFQSNVDFTSGGANLGATQYIDAYQKGDLYGIGGSSSGYHVLLGTPTVLSLQSLTVPKSYGLVTTAFGTKVIEASINWFDGQIQTLI